MAKRRRLRQATRQPRVDHQDATDPSGFQLVSGAPWFSGVGGFNPLGLAIGMLAGSIVYVAYYPSDSIAVEKGDALWFCALAIGVFTLARLARIWDFFYARLPNDSPTDDGAEGRQITRVSNVASESNINPVSNAAAVQNHPGGPSVLRLANVGLDVIPWLLAGWMMLAAFATSPPGNLRMATNEGWLWVAGACLFTTARISLRSLSVRQTILGLLIICGCGHAVHGMHQYLISLPTNRVEYRLDPEAVLREAMIDAPPGSAERMVFENRLMDGGPTATFALANSLAAALLVSVVLSGGLLLFSWRQLSWMQRGGWLLTSLLIVSCLLATRSRSALLAMLVAFALLLISASRLLQSRRRWIGWGLVGLFLAGTAGVVFLALFGNREWFEQAPASLAFRFQYWRSTWQMVLEHPWFGAGPGNFQSIYERYRELTATEQIAEPHNLLIETLASGGFIGLGLLLLIGGCSGVVVWIRAHASNDPARASSDPARASSDPARASIATGHLDAGGLDASARLHPPRETARCGDGKHGSRNLIEQRTISRWVWLGALLSLAMIWTLGWISRQTPDPDASLFVLPIAAMVAWLVLSSVNKLRSQDLDILLFIAMVAMAIHLMISGGWTVPGVALLIWIATGMLVRVQYDATASIGQTDRRQIRLPRGAALACCSGLALLLALWWYSLRPVEQQRRWMTRVADAQWNGRSDQTRLALDKAVAADPWSPDAVLWKADFYRWQLIRDPDDAAARQRWETALQQSLARAGDDPTVYRMAGSQQLHLYQKWGLPDDLEAAARSFDQLLRWSPANQWAFAQMAAIEKARGNVDSAQKLAEMADKLSRMGGNIERSLSRQMVYSAEIIGGAADRGPIRDSADHLLFEPNAPPSRISAE